MGFGALGLCAAVALHASGGKVTVLEFDPERRALAERLGFATLADAGDAPQVPLVVDAAGTPAAFAGGSPAAGLGRHARRARQLRRPRPDRDQAERDLPARPAHRRQRRDALRRLPAGDPASSPTTPIDLPSAITERHSFDALADPTDLFSVRPLGKALVAFA